jgi:serine/threonine protein kinase/tetratricopeptide (TPR) repeat protein
MPPERFQEIEELYHAARGKSAEERAALLADIDPEVRREVESLLAQSGSNEFLERPAVQDAAQLLGDPTLTGLTPGACLGPYRVERKLGEGGMGEVYRAVDTRLGRAVAIKIAQKQFIERFEREARAISSLNHPHVCTLYDVGPNYLVMELVEGETIAARLKGGPLPVKTALLYASQIMAALAEAHEKGIIHRDLKPGNIMIAKSGIKVLDFGLAKSGHDETVTASHMVLGTPAYMAPEQREGKPADARSDIYSFGCVLYEMVTGARVSAQRKQIGSRKIERIVSRCLEEDSRRRWHSAVELARELLAVARGPSLSKAGAAAAGVLAASVGAYFYLHRAPRLTDKDTIVLADFENKTGDPVFDDTLRQGLSVELQQSPFLSLIPDQQVQRTLALMGQQKDARLTAELARQVCERTGSAAVLEGSIASLGSQYILGLRARNCNTGSVLDQEQTQAPRREDVPNSLSQIARKFRTRIGESLATIEEHSKPLEEATTPSLEALKAYTAAMKLDSTAGIPLFRHAIEIDPKFAMAYANLGLAYSDIGESVLSAENTRKAWELRDRVSDQERFFIDFTYQREVTGNLEDAYQTLELWHRTYPRDDLAFGLLGGLSTHGTGRFDKAIEASRADLAAAPDYVFSYHNLASSYLFLDRFAEAESVLQQASAQRVEEPYLMVLRYIIAALKGDRDQMAQVVTLAKGKHGTEHWVAHTEGLALARTGRLQEARRSSNRAVDLALQEGDREKAASYRAARAVWEAAYGNAGEGTKSAIAALDLSKGREVEYAAGFALALSREFTRSDALAGDLEKRFSEDTIAKFDYVPVLRALSLLNAGKPMESVERLQTALQYELAANGLNFNHFYLGGLHSAYVRGEAFIAAHRYPEAAAEFQKILDHRGLVGLDPVGAMARLQLARALSDSGDRAKSAANYKDLLDLCRDADPDIPILKQAKAEYAKLQ